MVLVEAQSCGIPVIVGDSGGTKETMLLNKSGHVIDCTQENSIATTIAQLPADPERGNKMGDICRKHVEAELDLQANVQNAKLFLPEIATKGLLISAAFISGAKFLSRLIGLV